MKPFRKSRDFDGRFALTTLQNPNLEVRSCLEQIQDARRRVEARVDAEMAAEAAAESLTAVVAAVPEEVPEVVTLEVAAREVVEVGAITPEEPVTETPIPILAPATALARVPKLVKPRVKRAKPHKPARPRRNIASPRRRTVASYLPKPELTPLERHSRKCVICKHRDREAIEEDFLNWCHPDTIADDYHLNGYRAIYRHAHAIGLMERRSMNLRFAAESVIEHSAAVTPSADAVLRAIRMCTRINNRGEWHEPPSHVIVSSGGRINVDNRSIILNPSPDSLPQESAAIPIESPISNRQ